jgi:hypothetical protein
MEEFWTRCWSVFNYPILETDWNRMDLAKSVYVWFNAVEAALWMGLGIFVLARCLRHRHLLVEVVYSFCFFAFGLTDVLEMHRLTVGLLGTKLFVLTSILLARQQVVRHYDGAKL